MKGSNIVFRVVVTTSAIVLVGVGIKYELPLVCSLGFLLFLFNLFEMINDKKR